MYNFDLMIHHNTGKIETEAKLDWIMCNNDVVIVFITAFMV